MVLFSDRPGAPCPGRPTGGHIAVPWAAAHRAEWPARSPAPCHETTPAEAGLEPWRAYRAMNGRKGREFGPGQSHDAAWMTFGSSHRGRAAEDLSTRPTPGAGQQAAPKRPSSLRHRVRVRRAKVHASARARPPGSVYSSPWPSNSLKDVD